MNGPPGARFPLADAGGQGKISIVVRQLDILPGTAELGALAYGSMVAQAVKRCYIPFRDSLVNPDPVWVCQ